MLMCSAFITFNGDKSVIEVLIWLNFATLVKLELYVVDVTVTDVPVFH